ncbi:Por secretion system C-terminal sorting domain-containing protein [Flavobacterium haoranii]|uniref:Por secretion system C-terminal sorting domain-containing protein n=2 Tax=Flavobacterium haoranii TaxID=683124 RepID=A0A1M6L5R9_9FLAO|nr:Por secretion system C-terminal sorting domain-containing protein [Flavobacterium haoranii]
MKKITLWLFALLTSWQINAQFGCSSAVVIADGYTASNITTPGNGGVEDWNDNPTGTSINANYWDDDVYLFQYTAGATDEFISMTINSVNSWNGIGIFTTCTGNTFSGELDAEGTTGANSTKTVSSVVTAGQTVYIAVGQWGTPNGLNFSVTNFSVISTTSAPDCTSIISPADGANNVSSGLITWSPVVGLVTGYKLNVGTSAGATDVLNGADVGNVTSYNIGTLTGSTTYYVTIIPYNANGDATGCTETSFSSCFINVAPWTYDVETAAATTNSTIADCWSSNPTGTTSAFRWNVDDNGGTPSGTTTGPSGANSGVKYFYTEASSGTTGAVAELYTPFVDLSALADPSLQFYYHMRGVNMGELHIDIFDGTTWTDDVLVITGEQQTAATDPWNLSVVSLSAYSGNTVQVRFRGVRGAGFEGDISLDDISFAEAPACFDPINLVASNVTSSSVDFQFDDASGGNQFDFWYVVQPAGTGTSGTLVENYYDPGFGFPMTITCTDVDNDCANTGLQPNTAYEIYVRADCSSNWVGPINFTTSCVAITALPHQEGFDDALMPSCWNTALITGTTNWAPDDTNDGVPSPRTGARFAGKSWSGDNDSALLISPPYNLSAYSTDQVRLNVWVYRSANGIAADRITFFANTSPNVTGATTLVEVPLAISQAPTVPSAGWYNYIVDLPMSFNTIGDFYIIARGVTTSSFSSYSVGFDDYSLELTPSSPPVCASNIVATPDASCGNYATVITWDATPNAEGYYLTIGTSSGNNDVIDNLDLGNVTTYNFTGNHNSTYYYTLVPYNGVGPATGCTEMSFTTSANGCYCISNPTSVDGQGITNVQIVTTDFANTVNSSPVYNDHTATVVDMAQGINNNVQISFDTGFGYDYNIVIWIDANDDFNLDASEIVYTGLAPNTPIITFDASFVVPNSVPLGQHRMRIIATDALQTPSNPCYSGTYGETADFTINVVAPSCTPPAFASTTVSHDCANGNFNVNVDVTDLGNGSPSISDGTTSWPVSATGVIAVGPFNYGTPVTLTLLHGSDNVCNVTIGTFNYAVCPPANDECVNAESLTVGAIFADNSVVGTNDGATASTGAPAPGCASYSGGDVWYSAVVPASGSLTFEMNSQSGGITDGAGAVYSGSCGALTLLDCDDYSSSDPNDMPLIEVTGRTPGEVLYFRVWEYGNNSFGEFLVSAYDASLSTNVFENNNFRAYPNPVKDVLTLEYSSDITSVTVFNMLGQQVITRSLNATSANIDMSQLNAGAYLVSVKMGDVEKTIKVVKQ